jgi:hypothetical protein
MAVYDVALPVSAIVVVIIDFPNDILWVLLVQREIRVNPRMNENAVLIDVHQRQSLDPPQVLVGYNRHIGFVAFIAPVGEKGWSVGSGREERHMSYVMV